VVVISGLRLMGSSGYFARLSSGRTPVGTRTFGGGRWRKDKSLFGFD